MGFDISPRELEQIAHNLCSLHDFDPAFVAGQERLARAVIVEWERVANQEQFNFDKATTSAEAGAVGIAAGDGPKPPDAKATEVNREVADLADELIYGGGLQNRGVGVGLVVVEKADRSDPHYRLCDALERRRALSAEQGRA
jgi:hypothetical protein